MKNKKRSSPNGICTSNNKFTDVIKRRHAAQRNQRYFQFISGVSNKRQIGPLNVPSLSTQFNKISPAPAFTKSSSDAATAYLKTVVQEHQKPYIYQPILFNIN